MSRTAPLVRPNLGNHPQGVHEGKSKKCEQAIHINEGCSVDFQRGYKRLSWSQRGHLLWKQ